MPVSLLDLPALLERVDVVVCSLSLPRNVEPSVIRVTCAVGQRAYYAVRTLRQSGFDASSGVSGTSSGSKRAGVRGRVVQMYKSRAALPGTRPAGRRNGAARTSPRKICGHLARPQEPQRSFWSRPASCIFHPP